MRSKCSPCTHGDPETVTDAIVWPEETVPAATLVRTTAKTLPPLARVAIRVGVSAVDAISHAGETATSC